jgi:hypothetical protein
MANQLTPEQEQERLELIQRQNAAAKELASTYEKMAKTIKGINDEEKETLDIAKKISKASSDLEKAISKRLDKTSSVKDIQKAIQSLEQNSLKNNNLSVILDKKRLEAQKKFQQLDNDRVRLAKSLYDSQNLADEEAKKLAEKETELLVLSNSRLKVDRDRAKELAREVAELKTESKVTLYNLNQKQKQVDLAEKAADEQYEIVKQIQAAATANQKVNEELIKEIELLKQVEKTKRNKALLDALEEKFNIKKLKDTFTLIGFFKLLLDSALKFNEVSVGISKNLGYGADQADRLTQNLVGVSARSSNINVTLANASEAMTQLNESTGLVAEYSADTLETQIMLTKQFGLQADEAAGIYKLSVLNNKSASATNDAMVGAFVAARNSLKVGANFRQVMAEAAKVSGQLAANLGYSPERITKAVVAMKAFGTTLEQTKAQGEALLNFESSLEAELKAELLTGQQLNLERARAAALAGDQVELAKELANQGMTLEKFSKMNVLAQRSYAEAIGLSADQLSEQLKKQKLAKEQGKSLAQLTKEEALEAERRQKIQDKFNQTIDKVRDLLGNLVSGPLSMFLDGLSSIFSLIGNIIKPFALLADFINQSTAASITFLGTLGAIYAVKNKTFLIDKAQLAIEGAKKVYQTTEIAQLGIIQSIKSRGFFKTLADAAMTAFRSVAGIPIVGPLLGAAAAATAVGLGMKLFSKGDDVISPGYGKRVLSTPEGSIALNDKDTVVAGTNLDGGGGGTSIDLTPMINAINEVKAAVDRLYSKDTSISMDGKKVGTTLTQGSYKVA